MLEYSGGECRECVARRASASVRIFFFFFIIFFYYFYLFYFIIFFLRDVRFAQGRFAVLFPLRFVL